MGARQALTEKWLQPHVKAIPLSTQVMRVDWSAEPGLCDAVRHFFSLYPKFFSLLEGPLPVLQDSEEGTEGALLVSPEPLQLLVGSGISVP